MPRSAERVRSRTRKILKSFSVEKQDFGHHWEAVKESRYDGTLTDDGLEKLCRFLVVANGCGLPASAIPQRYMKKPLFWQNISIRKKSRKLCAKVRKRIARRQNVTDHPLPSDDEEAQDQASRPEEPAGTPGNDQTGRSEIVDVDAWEPPKVEIGEISLDNDQAVVYQHWLGPGDARLREEPPTNQAHVPLMFASGRYLFPNDLLEASAKERCTWNETVVSFDKAASVAQVPLSIPEPHRSACINKVRSCNPRLKPSHQECYESIIRCLKQKSPLHLEDMVALFCFLHYCVAETGRNRWLWQKMKLANVVEFCDPEYEWNIVENVVCDDQGRSLAHLITTEPPQPRHRRKARRQIGSRDVAHAH